jgi:peptide/nickel transport system permease protein
LGTDTLGRDVLKRLLVGTRPVIVGVAEAIIVFLLVAVPLGLISGYYGGRLDRSVMWVVDLLLAIPGIIVLLLVAAVFRNSLLAAMITYGVLVSPVLIRLVRASVLPVKEELYIAAAKVSGLSDRYIIGRHVLPRVAGPIIVQSSLLAAGAIIAQSGLAFLGLVVKPPAPSWGGMVAEGVKVIFLQPWLIWPSGIVIGLTILAFGLLGDGVRDAVTAAWARPPKRRRPRKRNAAEAEQDGPLDSGSGALLEIRGLSVSFAPNSRSRATQVIKDVSLEIKVGEILGVVGESGCGKSVTAQAILGLLPDFGHVDAGRIQFDGKELSALSDRELHRYRGRHIALISQEPMVSLNPTFRVGWQIAEVVRSHHKVSRREAQERAIDLLRQVNLPDAEAVARRYPQELSGGMAQRVGIARALAGEPELLIADEPTTALDVTVQAEILDLIRNLRVQRGMAVMLITHDWGVVADLCDRAVVLYAGEVVEEAPLIPLFRESLHPYTKELIAANPHGASGALKLPAIAGSVPEPGHWPSGCHFHPRCNYSTERCSQIAIPMEHPSASRGTRCIHFTKLQGDR